MIVVLNAGSSSLKYAVFAGETLAQRGQVDRIGAAGGAPSRLNAWDGEGNRVAGAELQAPDHDAALGAVVDLFRATFPGAPIQAVGHRVVHGGVRFQQPVRIDEAVLAELEALIPLAPLHQPHNLAPVHAIRRRSPELPQVACFDTAFHTTQDPLAQLFALPRELLAQGVRRYGFHGLSYEFIASQLPSVDRRAAEGRTVVCHLGNGASMCALRAGRSVATTMGFTALDGLPMGTRCGTVDPGILLYLLEHEQLSPAALGDLLYHRSGLLGLSGRSGDMRDLLADASPDAAEAVEFFCYRIARELGSLAAALGGLDALVFTGGIGEHAAPVRARVAERSGWLGVRLDPAANEANRTAIHAAESGVAAYVLPTNEELMIARHVERLVGDASHESGELTH
jgi:acetate kinase